MCIKIIFLQVVCLVYGELADNLNSFVVAAVVGRGNCHSKVLERRSVSSALSPRDERPDKSYDKELGPDMARPLHRALRNLDRARGSLCVLPAVLLSRRRLERIIELGVRHRTPDYHSFW
jgi:hypothetical protein